MPRVALFAFGVLVAPYTSEKVWGLYAQGDDVLAAARESQGFIAVADMVDPQPDKTPWEQNWGAWGTLTTPRFYQGQASNKGNVMQTLSACSDLKGASTFAYGRFHSKVLSNRREWFVKPEWPTYVLWWLNDELLPTWQEGCEGLEYLHDNGPSRQAFDPQGQPVQLNRPSHE